MTAPFLGWRGCCCIFAMKTTLLQISFLQSIVCYKEETWSRENKRHINVQNGLLHDNGRYRFQNIAKSKKKTHLGKLNTSSRMLRQTMQDCNGEVQFMNSPYSSTKATFTLKGRQPRSFRGVTRWQLRNCKTTRV